MTLTDFLEARITADEQDWRLVGSCDCAVEGLPLEHGVRCPVRGLAECATKRRLLDIYQVMRDHGSNMALITEVLCALTLPYAEHEQFREAWRP